MAKCKHGKKKTPKLSLVITVPVICCCHLKKGKSKMYYRTLTETCIIFDWVFNDNGSAWKYHVRPKQPDHKCYCIHKINVHWQRWDKSLKPESIFSTKSFGPPHLKWLHWESVIGLPAETCIPGTGCREIPGRNGFCVNRQETVMVSLLDVFYPHIE